MLQNAFQNAETERRIAVQNSVGIEEKQKTAHDTDRRNGIIKPFFFDNDRRGNKVAQKAAKLKRQNFVRHYDIRHLI